MLEVALKASKIAQKTRQNDKFLSILTQEKGLRNFQVDFKTLADVLIQQMIIKNEELELWIFLEVFFSLLAFLL